MGQSYPSMIGTYSLNPRDRNQSGLFGFPREMKRPFAGRALGNPYCLPCAFPV
jgi:hypothetical protein